MIGKLVSGGQTGVDRAGLDAALAAGLPRGGWCPRGRRAEDGPIPERYPLRESRLRAYRWRSFLNVRDSDATLVLTRGPPTGGTRLTLRLARLLGRPRRVVDLGAADFDEIEAAAALRDWLDVTRVRTLNLAGPRESEASGIYEQARAFMGRLWQRER